MTNHEVFNIVQVLVAEQHDEPVYSITVDTNFFLDLTDSLDFQEIVMACEERFGLSIPDEDAAKLETVGALVDYISSALGPGESVWPPPPL